MAYQIEKSGDIVFSGFEKGIAPSPHLGIASIRNANITTEQGEVMCNYERVQVGGQNQSITLVVASTSQVRWPSGTIPYVNQTVSITATPANGPTVGIYWVADVSEVGGNYFTHLYSVFDGASHNASAVSWTATSGNATATLLTISSTPVAGTTETYYNGTNLEYRYYIGESAGYVWCLDTGLSMSTFELIDSTQLSSALTGLTYFSGFLFAFFLEGVSFKITSILSQNPTNSGSTGWGTAGWSDYLSSTPNGYPAPHFCLNGHSGLFYTDVNFIGSVIAAPANIPTNFCYGEWSIVTDNTVTVSPLYAGAFPINGQLVTFYSDDAVPTGIALETTYYVINSAPESGTFRISTSSGGSLHDISGGSGNQYFTSWDPTNGTVNGNQVGNSNESFVATPQACTLPFFETGTALAELGNNLVIGTKGNTLYVWDEGAGGTSDISPQSFIPMAENNCQALLTVNNVVFDFRGSKGNIYVTSGSAASGVLTVPDYLSGTPGTPSSYIEPYFTFGQAFFMRGRVFFSIKDSNGNCGGIYSFIPSFFNPVTGQDAGTALRLENYNSYANYGGLANVIFAAQNQNANGVQYYAAWASGSSTYGIDASGTTPYTGGDTIIETDLVPTGQILGTQKKTFSGIEFKCAAPLQTGESVKIQVRQNGTDAWKDIGNYNPVGGSGGQLAAYYSPITFQKGLWLQLRAILTSVSSSPSFVRLTEITVHQ